MINILHLSALRALLPLLALVIFAQRPLAAQDASPSAAARGVIRGTVVRAGEPVPGVEVTLHRVRTEQSGPFAARAADGSGAFAFQLPEEDSANFSVFFATVEFEGARYFGPAVHPDDVPGEYTIEVFDSASVLPLPIRQSRRDMVLVPQADGGWEVDEAVRFHNPNALTKVSADGLPTWELRIPEGIEAFEVGEGEIPASQVQRMESRVLLTLPIPPGTRDLYIRYRLPGAREAAVLPFDSPADTFNLFIRQPSPTVSVTGLTSTDMITVENDQFLQYSGINLLIDSEVEIEWESSAPPVDPVLAGVVATLALLAVGALAAFRSRGPDDAASAQRSAAPGGLAVGRAE